MNCEETLPHLAERIHQPLDADAAARLEEHLRDCAACRSAAAQLEQDDERLDLLLSRCVQGAGAVAERTIERLRQGQESGGRSRGAGRVNGKRLQAVDQVRRRLGWVMAVGMSAAAVALLLHAVYYTSGPGPRLGAATASSPADYLMPRPRPRPPEVAVATVGQEVRTGPGERRRLALPDGSVVYVNQNSAMRVSAERRLNLSAGEVFVEVAPRDPPDRIPFVVQTPRREVSAVGTRFAVRAGAEGAGVVVAQGKVTLSDVAGAVLAGQQVRPDGTEVQPAPRLTHVLDWTRELMASAESPLVPASRHAGGALIAVDPSGQQSKLSLRRFHIDVHIEDGFARTTIDQTWFNHDPWRMEGTFYFPLPADASLSRLAMYVDGRLMEGGMAERDRARTVYEQIVHSQKDPALLEWLDGTTFKMRVFPLEGRQEKRIILSYTQRLPSLYGRASYRFPAGHSLDVVRHWSFHARVRNGAGLAWNSDSHPLTPSRDGNDLLLAAQARNVKPDRDVVLELGGPSPPSPLPQGESGGNAARFSSMEHDGSHYLMLRWSPELAGRQAPSARRQPRHWLFLFESSADRDPLLARVQVEIIRTLLENAEHDDTFTLLTAASRVKVFGGERTAFAGERGASAPQGAGERGASVPRGAPEKDSGFPRITASDAVGELRELPPPHPATPANVRSAIDFLERTHLVGALDLGNALRVARPCQPSPLAGEGTGVRETYLVHVGGGLPAMGQRSEDELLRLLPAGVKYVGVGVGKRWARNFMKTAAERTAGWFTQINPDEPVAWRSFDLLATLNTPRLLDVQVSDDAGRQYLTVAGLLADGEELCAITRIDPRGADGANDGANAPGLPRTVTVRGRLNGRPFERAFPVENVVPGAGYLPRTWARLEIDRLLAEDAHRHREYIVELSKAMYVMTPFTSLLVLENEAMYEEFGVDRGRKDHWAMYPAPERIEVVYEPDPLLPVDVRNAPPTPKPAISQVRNTIVRRGRVQWLRTADSEPLYKEALAEYAARSEERGRALRGSFFADGDDDARDLPVLALPLLGAGSVHRGVPNDSVRFDIGDSAVSQDRIVRRNLDQVLLRNLPDRGLGRWRYIPGLDASAGLPQGPFGEMSSQLNRGRRRFADLLNSSEDLRVIEDEWERIWIADQPSRLPVQPVHGEINGRFFTQTLNDDDDAQLIPNLRDLYGYMGADLRRGSWSELAFLASMRRVKRSRSVFESPAPDSSLYQRPAFNFDERLFTDLLGYAPGFQTSAADELAVLDAEAMPQKGSLPGRIDPAARKLIDRARQAGWQALVISPGSGARRPPEFRAGSEKGPENRGLTPPARPVILRFDGAGRFAFERTLPLGLCERVVCDGAQLWHLYPELGVGTRRPVSRFHRAELAQLVPWLLPPAEDLARGADLQLVDDHTVAIVPRGGHPSPPFPQGERGEKGPILQGGRGEVGERHSVLVTYLVFAGDGRLVERRLLLLPEGKTLLRLVYDPVGVVQLFDGQGKLLGVRELALAAAPAPELEPDVSNLVVLPLPWRSREHVYRFYDLDPGEDLDDPANGCFEYLEPPAALELLACEVAAGNGQRAAQVYRRHFADKGDRRLGFYTLLASSGHDLAEDPDFVATAGRHWTQPLARYLALVASEAYRRLQPSLGLDWSARVAPEGSFLGELARFRDLYLRWYVRDASAGWAPARRLRQQQAVDFVRRHRGSPFGLATLCLLQQRAGDDAGFHRELAGLWGSLSPSPPSPLPQGERGEKAVSTQHSALSAERYLARYEQARNLFDAGEKTEARRRFRELYESVFEQGVLPPIDSDFRQALVGSRLEEDEWIALMQWTASRLIANQQRPAVVALAWQCWELNDTSLANGLAEMALDQPGENERLAVNLAAIQFYRETARPALADERMQVLLADPKLAEAAPLWRLAGEIAEARGQAVRAIDCLERALDLEYRQLPEVIDLRQIRADYGKLLEHYRWLAQAAARLGAPLPEPLAARVVKAADRWRALDPGDPAPSQQAAHVLKLLGAADLAWDYLTTPIGLNPGEAQPWRDLAWSLEQEGELNLADLAYQAAFEAEPTNAEILWERAQLLKRAGRRAEARRVLGRIAQGQWQPRFNWIQSQARQQAGR
jgi:hypothetical protein